MPKLDEILNPEVIGVATRNILLGLPQAEQDALARLIVRAVETAVHEAIDPPAPNEDHQEFWWIYSASLEPWGGLRQAVFRRAMNGPEIMFIYNEPIERTGPRDWADVSVREGWSKVMRIPVPSRKDLRGA